jgi:hypothetical protein
VRARGSRRAAVEIMNWFWLNASLGAAFVLPVVGAPLWLVLRYPDNGPPTAVQAGPSQHHRQAAMNAEAHPLGLAWPGPLRAEAQPPTRARLMLDDAWMRVLAGAAQP